MALGGLLTGIGASQVVGTGQTRNVGIVLLGVGVGLLTFGIGLSIVGPARAWFIARTAFMQQSGTPSLPGGTTASQTVTYVTNNNIFLPQQLPSSTPPVGSSPANPPPSNV